MQVEVEVEVQVQVDVQVQHLKPEVPESTFACSSASAFLDVFLSWNWRMAAPLGSSVYPSASLPASLRVASTKALKAALVPESFLRCRLSESSLVRSCCRRSLYEARSV